MFGSLSIGRLPVVNTLSEILSWGLFSLDNAGPDFWKILNSGKYQIMCINDGFNIQDEEQVMTDFIKAMDQLLPDRSSFEI